MTGFMMPPLQLSLGSSASSGAGGSTGVGTGMGAINEGPWTIQNGQGNSSSATMAPPSLSATGIGTAAKPTASGSTLLLVLGAAALFLLMKK